MRIREAAQVLGISRESLQKLEREGLIQPIRSRGGHRFYPPEILEAARRAFFPAEPKIHTPPAGFTRRNATYKNRRARGSAKTHRARTGATSARK